jgi:drug/metabolite transporter (DMT)-like permease
MSKQVGVLGSALTAAAAVGFVASWSSGFVIAKVATVDAAPLTLLVWRFLPVAVGLVTVTLATGAARGVPRADLRRQAVIGLFAQLGYVVLVYAAIAAGVATGTTALIDAVQPLVVATLVGPLLGLRVRGAQWAGLGVGAVGVLLVVRSQLGGSDAPPAAYLLPLAAMACLVAGTFLERRSSSRPPVQVVLTVQVAVTTAVLLLAAVASGTLAPPADAGFWVATALAAAFPTLAAYGLYWWLLRRVGVTALNALLFLVAPATAAAGALWLDEPLTAVTLAGFALCGAGVAVVLAVEARAARAARATPVARGVRGGRDAGPDAITVAAPAPPRTAPRTRS